MSTELAKQAASSEEEDKVDWKQWEKLLGEEGEESERNLPRLPCAHASQNHRWEKATSPPLPSNRALRHFSG